MNDQERSTSDSRGMRLGWFIVPVVLVAVGIGMSWWFGRAPEGVHVVGGKMPPLTVEFVQGGSVFAAKKGELTHVSAVPAKMLIVNFWASWCESCREEGPELEAFWKAHQGEGIAMVGVAFNDDLANIKAVVREIGKTYPIALDPTNRAAMDYGITGVPETFFIGSDGTVVHKEIGPVDRDLLESMRSSMMGTPEP